MTTWKSVIVLGVFLGYLCSGGQSAQAQGLADVVVTSSGCSLTNLRIVQISMSESAIAGDLTMTRGEECDINATWPPGFLCEANSLSWQRSSSFSCTTGFSPPALVDTEIVSPYAARWTLSAPSEGSDCSGNIWLYVRNPTTCLTIALTVTVPVGSEDPEDPPPTVTVDDVLLLINSAMLQEELAFLDIKEENYQDAYEELGLAFELITEASGGTVELRESSQITIADAYGVRAALSFAAEGDLRAWSLISDPDNPGTPATAVDLKWRNNARMNLLVAHAFKRMAVRILEGQETSELFLE